MSRRVFRYSIPRPDAEGRFQLELPRYAMLLSAQAQITHISLWALVEDTAETEVRHFIAANTGSPLPGLDKAFLIPVSTVQMGAAPVVWHIFEVRPPAD